MTQSYNEISFESENTEKSYLNTIENTLKNN